MSVAACGYATCAADVASAHAWLLSVPLSSCVCVGELLTTSASACEATEWATQQLRMHGCELLTMSAVACVAAECATQQLRVRVEMLTTSASECEAAECATQQLRMHDMRGC